YQDAEFKTAENHLVSVAPGAAVDVSRSAFREFSDLQEIGFNITASLLDPETYEDTQNLVAEIDLVFTRALELAAKSVDEGRSNNEEQEVVVQTIKDVVTKIRPHNVAELKGSQVAAGCRDEILDREVLAQSAAGYQKNRIAQQRLLARVRLLWWRMSLP